MKIGPRLRQIRQKAELTQEDVAEICGVTKSMVSQWESNTVLIPTDRIIALRKKLDFSVDWLLIGGNQEMYASRESVRELVGIAEGLPDYAVIKLSHEGRTYTELIQHPSGEHGKKN